MKEFIISRKRIMFISVIIILTVIAGLYATYALNVYVEPKTPTTYDLAYQFDISNTLDTQVAVAAGKKKTFDITITNPYADSVNYGVAYSMVSPTTLPSGLKIAQTSISKSIAVGTIAANSSVTVSIIVINDSTSAATVSFSVINGYKNGGDLIIPSGKTLVAEVYDVTGSSSEESFEYTFFSDSLGALTIELKTGNNNTNGTISITGLIVSYYGAGGVIGSREDVVLFDNWLGTAAGKEYNYTLDVFPNSTYKLTFVHLPGSSGDEGAMLIITAPVDMTVLSNDGNWVKSS